ncbi:hypothetical protein O7627_25265 [Solwaraspora sp. WMMD1047]|uniref:hypothetical protein n=1 Tax=Solwaraspora sp. WMMD1047 TaxID=3016102 RepID=UPI002415EA58|nr:hypothetical protein [Solwaraspora sp. WMMD1047]MDG4832595.1 hypothetical protein [Solwaraspora sp. WMMD1047]
MRSGTVRPNPPPVRPGPHTAAVLPSLLLLILVFTPLACANPGTDAPAPAGGPNATAPAGDPSVTAPAGDGSGALDRALLPAAEIGPHWREIREPAGSPSWPWAQPDCPAYQDTDYPAQQHRDAAAQRGYRGPGAPALQVVEAYQPGWGSRAMDDARQVLRACSHYDFLGGQVSFAVQTTAPVGDDVLVVRGAIARPGRQATVSYFLAVRQGDLVTTLNVPDSGGQRIGDLAGELAERLAP